MREILFRGKLPGTDEWVEGYVVKGQCTYILTAENIHYMSVSVMGHANIDVLSVKPDSVGQYTGLTDKNGKRIFEGDIVDCWSEGVNAQGTVQQRRDGLWIIFPAWQKTIMWGLCPDEYSNTSVEVIGNIHDNPELIVEVEG